MAASVIYAVSAIGSSIGGITAATTFFYAVEIGTALYYAAIIAASPAYSDSRKRTSLGGTLREPAEVSA